MNHYIEKLYFSSPILFQNIMSSVYGYKLYRERYTGNHNRYLKELLETQWFSKDEIEKYVIMKLRAIVADATTNVQFYRNVALHGIIKPEDISCLEDLRKFPIINKEQLRVNPKQFINSKIPAKEVVQINTSGTTGKTLTIYVNKDSRRLAYAFFSRLKLWAGIERGLPNATFAGRNILSADINEPPFWRRNLVMNNYLFSSYHLSSKNMYHYVKQLKKIQPVFIDSYPSAIYNLALFMKENDLGGIYPDAIITSAETLFDHQRILINEIFKCPVYDQYGSAEQVVFVSQCEKGTYHVHPEFGIVEFLREDGTKAMPGEPARIICTGFTNRMMPLIRYDIGDIGTFSNEQCPCGRNFPVIEKIVGRTDDILVTRDGRKIGRLDPIFKGLQSIKEAQIIQEDYDLVLLKVVPGRGFSEHDGSSVINELKKRLGADMRIKLLLVTEIPRTSAGKFRAVISNIGG